MTESVCEWLREVGPELALGLLSPQDRTAALAHLDRCPECRDRVADYTQVGDGLLALLPGVEPPVGFEDRVLARVSVAAPVAPVVPLHRRRRGLVLAAAAAVAALVFGLGGWAVGRSAEPAPAVAAPTELVHGTLRTVGHQTVGEVWEYTGRPQPWLYMHVANQPTNQVSCELQRRDGSVVDVGSFRLTDGSGSWGAPSDVNPGDVTGARLVGSDGTLLASAGLNGS
jgi:hypothetical protein